MPVSPQTVTSADEKPPKSLCFSPTVTHHVTISYYLTVLSHTLNVAFSHLIISSYHSLDLMNKQTTKLVGGKSMHPIEFSEKNLLGRSLIRCCFSASKKSNV